MSRTPRMLPRFERSLSTTPTAFYGVLKEALQQADGPCIGTLFRDGAILRMRHEQRQIWSPALHLYIERSEETGERLLHGRFTPSSPVWTAFVAIYLGLLCVATAGGCWGWAQYLSDETPWALLAVPGAAALAGFTYGAAFIGQGLGAEDMYELRSFVDRVVERSGRVWDAPKVQAASSPAG